MSKKDLSHPFQPGGVIGDFTLIKRLSRTNGSETWLAHCAKTDTQKQITLNINKGTLRELRQQEVEAELQDAPALKRDQQIDQWLLLSQLGLGTNGQVWEARHSKTNQVVALKICMTKLATRQQGFIEEVHYLQRLQGDPGVIPLLAASIKADASTDNYSWMAMPVAKLAADVLRQQNNISLTVAAICEYLSTALRLLAQQLLYSDIKKNNSMYYKDRFVLIDFNTLKKLDESDVATDFKKYTERFGKLFNDFTEGQTVPDALQVCFDSAETPADLRDQLITWLQANANETDYLNIGVLLHRNACLDNANYFYEAFLTKNPKHAQAHYLTGGILLENKQYANAGKCFQTAQKLSPSENHVLALASTQKYLGKYKKATVTIEQALVDYPQSMRLYTLLGEIHQQLQISNTFKKIKITHKHSLTTDDEKRLTQAFKKRPTLISCEDNRLRFQGKVDPEHNESYGTISWDQYFHDLSMGSYRTVYDGQYRPYRARSWHYLFKNLKLIDDIHKLASIRVNILDVGCSSGYLCRFLEGNQSKINNKQLYYWGLDIREDVLIRAVHAKTDIETSANIVPATIPSAFLQHDISNGLPYNDASFDVIVNFEMIKYLPTQTGQNLIKELYRVLKPGGLLFISSSFGVFKPGFIEGLDKTQFVKLLTAEQFNITAVRGSQANFDQLQAAIKPAHRQLVKDLLACHPPEIVSAIIAPLYPNNCSQLVFQASKGTPLATCS